jgi:predicted GIY-YIG superfamily endonuclease
MGSGCDPTPCRNDANGEINAGVYLLVDKSTGQIRYVGRTNNFDRREKEHLRDPDKSMFQFEPVFRTHNLLLQKGIEQVIYQAFRPDKNRINPISPSREDFEDLFNDGEEFMKCNPVGRWGF